MEQRRPWIFAPATAAHANGQVIDVRTLNAPARAYLEGRPGRPKVLVIPGFTPVKATEPEALSSTSRKRLDRAVRLQGPHGVYLVSGGNVHPEGTPFNEGFHMREYLLHHHKIDAERVILDPYARHSTTNLRNAGRFLLAWGFEEATVVTTFGQAFYFGLQRISSFAQRCKKELGYVLGSLTPLEVDLDRIAFRPDVAVFTRGTDPLDP
jgi:hypothetical protein